MYVRIFAAVWLLVCAVLAVVAWGFQAPFSYDPVGPRAYPLLLLFLMATAALWLIYKPGDADSLPISWPLARKVALCVLALFAYALLFEPLGFVVSTSLVGFGLGLLFMGRPLASLVSGVLMGLLLYGLFDYLLDVPLPLGLLAFLEN
ncbi:MULTISPECIES: tripartite tricarboxylate transporter TctB family protein [unclassified Pseudomonas]|jgi:putative tricarboxylic transport membrane protein|uniref:tripartite tricarboxylate transporter TctB family protein n=1 Tax=unclassified Pseudomonas TaxID=196821 RepID=UPI000EA9C46B|nr:MULTISPECIES: tripartite tricarboxylate transporter TctB family protein [unclassified Pseudomonas]AYF87930.1 tripartite tricarboxylate transporter TctB family protein [Pseudomonas sp. DY-1]MDH4655716.1 tripartite tricarboxylate transporter TctB family protein [Pseudomonas sp. BN606]MRK19159.1 tripartite tricarboxylate transporter TctB family protein [Pseudomonas sp. JG-B]